MKKHDGDNSVMALAMSTVMTVKRHLADAEVLKGDSAETAKEQQQMPRPRIQLGKVERREESSAEAVSGNYGDKTIGFVGMTLNNEYHITLANGAKVEAEAKGVKIEVQVETVTPR